MSGWLVKWKHGRVANRSGRAGGAWAACRPLSPCRHTHSLPSLSPSLPPSPAFLPPLLVNNSGKLELFAANARIVHVDIDPAEIHKNKDAFIPICSDIKPALQQLNRMLEAEPLDRSGVSWVCFCVCVWGGGGEGAKREDGQGE